MTAAMAHSHDWSRGSAAIDHVGILTEDFDAVIALFGEQMGFDVSPPQHDEELGLSFLWVQCGDVPLEFIRPLVADNGAARRMREHGPGVDHIALRVESVHDALAWCRERDIALIDREPRRGAHDSRIAFLAPEVAGGARVELVERHENAGRG
jgi:methylmalonyl-CoA/ethylmalonyl-CoA epimerase